MGRWHKLAEKIYKIYIIHPYLKLCTHNLFKKVVGGIVIEEKIVERYLIFYTAWLFLYVPLH